MTRFLACLLLCLPPALQAAEPSGAPFLWQVQTATTRHYLMGSIHLLPQSAYPLPPALEAAYNDSKGVVFESDLAALSSPDVQMKMLSAARDVRAEGLKAQVPPALYEQLKARAATLHMPMQLCDAFKPWYCALTLEVFSFEHAGFEAGLGLDQHFFARANDDDKPVRWLESPESHLALFTDMPDSLSQQFLAATLEEQDEDGAETPENLLRMWRESDLGALEKAALELRTHHAKAYERLLAGRNRAWLPVLSAMLDESAPLLVIVGAAHLPGPDGLIALLREKGYKVEPATAGVAPAPAAQVSAAR